MASLDQYLDPPLYRPLHFLGFLVIGLVIYRRPSPQKRWAWTRRDSVFVAASAFTAAAVWAYEFLFSYQVSHLGGIMIYMIPLGLFILGPPDDSAKTGRIGGETVSPPVRRGLTTPAPTG